MYLELEAGVGPSALIHQLRRQETLLLLNSDTKEFRPARVSSDSQQCAAQLMPPSQQPLWSRVKAWGPGTLRSQGSVPFHCSPAS